MEYPKNICFVNMSAKQKKRLLLHNSVSTGEGREPLCPGLFLW